MRERFADGQLIQILLPLADNAGRRFPDATWEEVKRRLADRFGGVTAYARAPAEGIWAPASGAATRDEVFVVEVMAPTLDEGWWLSFQAELERRLGQERIVIRALPLREI
jgi:hypothetical protein